MRVAAGPQPAFCFSDLERSPTGGETSVGAFFQSAPFAHKRENVGGGWAGKSTPKLPIVQMGHISVAKPRLLD